MYMIDEIMKAIVIHLFRTSGKVMSPKPTVESVTTSK